MKMIKMVFVSMLLMTMVQAEKFSPGTDYSGNKFERKVSTNEKFDLVAYKKDLLATDKIVKENWKKNLEECKIRAERAKRYRAYLDRNPDLNKTFTDSVVESCQARVAAVCGVLMSANIDINSTK